MVQDMIKTAMDGSIKKTTNLRTIAQAMDKSNIFKNMLSEIDKLLKIYFTIPITSATAERGFSSQSLLCEKPSVLVLSEHWLWPYELHRLNDISDNYAATGKADSRLTETSNGGRGFGGIAILWHKTIGATPMNDITSDRICAIRFCDPKNNLSYWCLLPML